jgi:hypothetical protein
VVTLNGSTLADVSIGGTTEDHINNIENVVGGSGDDVLTGDAADNHFDLSAGGNDSASGGDGNDTFVMGAAFTAADQIDGGNDFDTLSLDGDYSAGVTLGATTLVNVENITLANGHDYKLTTNDATVAHFAHLAVDASALDSSHHLIFDGSAEANGGHFDITSGNGSDTLTGGPAGDEFIYTGVTLSGATRDTINGFDFAGNDIIDLTRPSGIDTAVTSGALNEASFDSDLATALSGHLQNGHAILFTPDSGDLAASGDTFLVLDRGIGHAGYQTGEDLVIQLHNPQNVGSFSPLDFV